MVLAFYHFILLSMFLFSLLWQKWASIHFLITVEEEKHRLTEGQPMTVTTTTTKKKQTKTNKLSTTSAQCALFYMHSVDQCTQPQFHLSYLWSNTSTTQLPVGGVQTCPIFRFWGSSWNKKVLYLQGRVKNRRSKSCWLCIWLFRVHLEEGSSS